ncbi:hypothetical protein TNCV_2503441 [Trichonephila clavipes]|nr:hypothetical protein TNCV_2503441 [Trichonephila clavipes]
MVKVSDRDRLVTSNPVPLKIHRERARFTLNLSRAQTSSRWCGVVGEGVPAQVSSSSLDGGSKLRGPSPKQVAEQCDVNIHSLTDSFGGLEERCSHLSVYINLFATPFFYSRTFWMSLK